MSSRQLTCVLLNPVLERIYLTDEVGLGRHNFLQTPIEVPSGQGIAAARTATILREKATVLGFVGGPAGIAIEQLTRLEGIGGSWIRVEQESRRATTLVERTGRCTMFVDPSPEVAARDLLPLLLSRIRRLDAKVVIVGGSLPAGLPETTYSELLQQLPHTPVVMVDTREATLTHAAVLQAYLLKMSIDTLTPQVQSLPEAINWARGVIAAGARFVLLSLGAEGALLLSETSAVRAKVPKVRTLNTFGCGDAMLGGFAVGILRNLSPVEAFRLSVACGVANSLTLVPGQVDAERVAELEALVELSEQST